VKPELQTGATSAYSFFLFFFVNCTITFELLNCMGIVKNPFAELKKSPYLWLKRSNRATPVDEENCPLKINAGGRFRPSQIVRAAHRPYYGYGRHEYGSDG